MCRTVRTFDLVFVRYIDFVSSYSQLIFLSLCFVPIFLSQLTDNNRHLTFNGQKNICQLYKSSSQKRILNSDLYSSKNTAVKVKFGNVPMVRCCADFMFRDLEFKSCEPLHRYLLLEIIKFSSPLHQWDISASWTSFPALPILRIKNENSNSFG